MARRKRGVRIQGPYKHGDRWRVYVVDLGGNKTVESYESEEKAKQVIRSFRRQLREQETPTLDEALTMYADYMKDDKGNKSTSIKTTTSRLRSFFGDLTVLVGELGAGQCERLYDAFTARKTRMKSKTAVDTHRNALSQAKTFLSWCAAKKKWISKNPMADLEGRGARRHGKAQLRIDESRKWLDQALQLAAAGDAGAIAASLSLLMGLRASEIVERTARDLDDQGRVLWIPIGKTRNAVRKLAVPEVLREFLLALADGKQPEERLFGLHWRDWPRKNVKRICDLAGVAKVTAHGMRGTHATLAVDAGATGRVVAGALGHGSETVTFGSYVAPGTKEAADARAVLSVIQGGKTDAAPVETIDRRIVSTDARKKKTRAI